MGFDDQAHWRLHGDLNEIKSLIFQFIRDFTIFEGMAQSPVQGER